jgi:outer membrane protein insertion porin family
MIQCGDNAVGSAGASGAPGGTVGTAVGAGWGVGRLVILLVVLAAMSPVQPAVAQESGEQPGDGPAVEETGGESETTGDDAQSETPSRGGGAETDETENSPEPPVIADIEMTCDLEECGNPINIDKYLDIAGLYVGRRFDQNLLETARKRLRQTGLFESMEFTVERPAPGSVHVSVDAIGATRVRDIKFVGVDPPPFRSDLRKLLIYRQGEAYTGEVSKKNTQLASLESAFEKEGYFGTTIHMNKRPVDGNRKLVDLVFEVDKGESLDICEIGIRGLEAMTYSEAKRRVLSDVSVFARELGLVDPRFTTSALKAGRESLIRAYRRRGYYQMRITDEAVHKAFERGCVRILLDVDEGPHWAVEFDGNRVVEADELRDELPFEKSGYVDRAEIRNAERAIRQLYETRGYPFAKVEGREARRDRLHRTLHFEIQEGPRVEIDRVRIHGNDAIGDDKLRERLGTRPFRVFESGGYLQTEQLLNDFRKIEKSYREKGYLRAVVERYALEVDEGEMTVHIYVREGTKTRASQVRFDGVRSLSFRRIEDRVGVHTGEPYVPVQVRADESRIQQLYSSVGYPLASVETECRRLTGQQVACERPKLPAKCLATTPEMLEGQCGWKSDEKRRYVCRRVGEECAYEGGVGDAEQVRVRHTVEEGPLVTTGELLIQGNFRTLDRVIHRELPFGPGDIFDVRKILEGQSNLRSLGIFDSVSVEAMGLDEEASEAREQRASLAVSVEESRNRFAEFKFGFEGRNLLGGRRKLLTTGEMQYSDRNVLGSAFQLEPRVFGAADMVQLSNYWLTDAEGGAPGGQIDHLLGAEIAFEDPRFLKGALGIDKLHLTVTPFYLVDLLGVTNDQLLREEWGLALEFRKELTEVMDRFFVSFGVEGKQTATTSVEGPRVDGERIFSPRRVTGKLIPKLTLDRRDSPLNPSKGYFLRLRPELVSGDALSRNIDTIDDSYLRLTWKSDLFVPIWENVVLAQGLRVGQVVPLFGRQTRVPADERYFMGGAGSVRGFPNNSLGPKLNNQPAGGEFLVNYNLELRYPLLRGIDLRGAAFFDTGVLVDCFDDEQVTRRTSCYGDAFGGGPVSKVRSAAGVGLRYVIAEQIPLLFDYGISLDRQQNEGIGNLQFHLGYTF